jgi:hypothetical protein
MAQVKISGMVETKEDPAGGWIPVVLNNKNYKYNPGSYVQQKTIDNIRGLSPTNLPANYVYYVTDPGKQGFFRYDNADAASVDDGAVVLVTKNNLRFKRIIENNTVSAKWFEMGNNPAAAINTLIYLNNTAITYAQAQAIFNMANSRATISTTDFTTQNATWFALQRAINFCLQSGSKLYIPAGQYSVSKGLLVAPPPNGFAGGVEIEGAATAYNGGSSQTLLQFTDKNSFGLGLHRVKGARVRNLFLMGQNKIGIEQGRTTLYDWFENPNMDWTGGCRNTTVSPHAGFIVDPLFNEGGGGEPDKYPGFESVYTDPGGSGGSTDVIFDNCRSDYFVVGYCFSPHGAPQNGDNIAVNNSWVNYCKAGISVGQSQNRSVMINNLKCWGGVEAVFDNVSYSDGTADQVDVDQLQIAGGVKYLVRGGGWALKGLQIRRMHAESLMSLGGGGDIVIDDSFVTLLANFPSERVHAARSAFCGNNLVVKNSFFGTYQGSNSIPLVINSTYSRFENCQLDAGVVNLGTAQSYNLQHDVTGIYRRVRFNSSAELPPWNPIPFKQGDEFEMRREYSYRRVSTNSMSAFNGGSILNKYSITINQPIVLSSVDETAMEAVFSLPVNSIDLNSLIVGDIIVTNDNVPNEMGVNSGFLMGRVKSKDAGSGSVTLELTGKGLNTSSTYYGTVIRDLYMIPSFMMGTITNGSNVVTNVLQESVYFMDWSGYTIVSPFFPPGTTIVSVDTNAKTFTMSNNATATVKGIEIISADWNAILYGSEPYVQYTPYGYSSYKKNDVIYNTDILNFPDVEKWVCTKSGFLGQPATPPYIAEFNTYYKNVTSTFTATSNTTTGSTITNGQMVVSKGRFIQNIVVSSDKALSVQIGTTLGGNDILANTSLTANTVNRVLTVNKFCNAVNPTTTLYIKFTQTNTTAPVTANVTVTVMK